jgi:hypothetical protein
MVEPQISIDGDEITIVAKLDPKGEPSSTGKTLVLATTRGNQKVTTDDGVIFVGLNIFKKP